MGRGQTDRQTHIHTYTHFNTVNRPGLRAGSIENNTINMHNTVKCFSEDKRNKKKYVHKVKAKESGKKVEVEIGEIVCHDDKD